MKTKKRKTASYSFLYKIGRKKRIERDNKRNNKINKIRYNKLKKLMSRGLSLREMSLRVGISHEMIRQIIIKYN